MYDSNSLAKALLSTTKSLASVSQALTVLARMNAGHAMENELISSIEKLNANTMEIFDRLDDYLGTSHGSK